MQHCRLITFNSCLNQAALPNENERIFHWAELNYAATSMRLAEKYWNWWMIVKSGRENAQYSIAPTPWHSRAYKWTSSLENIWRTEYSFWLILLYITDPLTKSYPYHPSYSRFFSADNDKQNYVVIIGCWEASRVNQPPMSSCAIKHQIHLLILSRDNCREMSHWDFCGLKIEVKNKVNIEISLFSVLLNESTFYFIGTTQT